MAKRVPSWLMASVAGLALGGGCIRQPVPGHSADHYECLRYCSSNKDTCMLQATNAEAVQECDSWGAPCAQQCPY
jgi:hypothetical protein